MVQVAPPRRSEHIGGLLPTADPWSFRDADEELLRGSVGRATAIAPDSGVTGELIVDAVLPALVARAEAASLLVLSGRRGARGRGLLGRPPSVCARVAASTGCPVAVIGPLPAGPLSGAPPRVVVGVDGRGWCSAALRFAFRAAAQRAVPVVAVHVWTPDLPADHEGVCGSPAAAEALTGAVVDRTLAPARRAFPHVPVEVRLTGTNPADELVRASDGAAMVVVGSRARGAVRAGLFGSVGRSVVRRARCPVVVVGPDRTTPPAPRRAERHLGVRPTWEEPLHRWGVGWG